LVCLDGVSLESGTHDLVFDWVRQHVRDLTIDQPPTILQKCNKPSFVAGAEKFLRADRAFAMQSADWNVDHFLLGTPAAPSIFVPAKTSHRVQKIALRA
jgi:hypothetical protein